MRLLWAQGVPLESGLLRLTAERVGVLLSALSPSRSEAVEGVVNPKLFQLLVVVAVVVLDIILRKLEQHQGLLGKETQVGQVFLPLVSVTRVVVAVVQVP